MTIETEIKTADALASQAEAAKGMESLIAEISRNIDPMKADQRDRASIMAACINACRRTITEGTTDATLASIARDATIMFEATWPMVRG